MIHTSLFHILVLPLDGMVALGEREDIFWFCFFAYKVGVTGKFKDVGLFWGFTRDSSRWSCIPPHSKRELIIFQVPLSQNILFENSFPFSTSSYLLDQILFFSSILFVNKHLLSTCSVLGADANITPSLSTKSLIFRIPNYVSFHGVCMLSHFSCVWLFAAPWTVARRLLFPWDSPGKNTEVGYHALLQGIFPTQGIKPTSPALLAGSLLLSHQGSPLSMVLGSFCPTDA